MTNYAYIMSQCRKYHFMLWDENVLRECHSIMPNLIREERTFKISRIMSVNMHSLSRIFWN